MATTKTNVYSKLQQSRIKLQGMKLKKSGVNRYRDKKSGKIIEKFKYYELGDFLPPTMSIFAETGLFSHVNFFEGGATLTVIDCDNPDSKVEFSTDDAAASLIGGTPIQELGAKQTYLRRYLYMNAMEIVENDYIDSQDQEDNKKETQKKPAPKKPAIDKSKFKVPGSKDFKEITQDQRKRLLGIAKAKGLSNEDVKKLMEELFAIDSSTKLDQETSYKLLVKQIDPKEG